MKFRRLKANEIDARVATINSKGCSLLLYKDARVDQNILDETVGAENWQRSHELIGDRLYCTVSIWDASKGIWVSKQDVGTESYTEKEKGQASDSFKRACFNWGIGRELYTAPFIWITAGNVHIADKNGKPTTYDTFTVKEIGYNDLGEINRLKIQNDKQKQIVYTFGVEQEFPKELEPITANEQEVLKALCARKGLDPSKSFPNGIDKLTAEQYAQAVAKLGKLKDAT
ncbi:hypothetical protein [Butyrivibrio virus Ceridwen]|nr:hypothetical protein [Butyrivibrio virus Ceridwen]